MRLVMASRLVHGKYEYFCIHTESCVCGDLGVCGLADRYL